MMRREQVLKEAERILNASDVHNKYYAKMLYENFGDHYRYMKKYDAATLYFEKSMNIAVTQYGERSDEVADVYRYVGSIVYGTKDV